MQNIFFTQAEIRAISESRVRLVETFQYVFADSCKAVQILLIYAAFTRDTYVKKLTFTLYCDGVCVEGAIKALLV